MAPAPRSVSNVGSGATPETLVTLVGVEVLVVDVVGLHLFVLLIHTLSIPIVGGQSMKRRPFTGVAKLKDTCAGAFCADFSLFVNGDRSFGSTGKAP